MHLRWKEVEVEGSGRVAFMTTWENHEVLICRSMNLKDHSWYIWVDGVRTNYRGKSAYATPHAAMEAVNTLLDNMVGKRARSGLTAQQREAVTWGRLQAVGSGVM